MLDLSDFLLIRGINYELRYSIPYVELSQLKRLAEALSFIIIPVDYSNFINVVEYNIESNKGDSKKVSEESEYWSRIYTLYNKFIEKIGRYQAAYILAPVNYYSLYNEAMSKEVMSKYFPECYGELPIMFELLLPFQRLMLKTIRQLILAQNQLFKDSERTASWFESMSKEIREMTVQNMRTSQYLYSRLEEEPLTFKERLDAIHKLGLRSMDPLVDNFNYQRKLQNTLVDLYMPQREPCGCWLDPLIFSIERDVDVSSKNSDDVKANLGFVFGSKMPDEFFTEKGLTKNLHKNFLYKDITHTFIPKD